ncbi:hypothetical protein DFH28DRAFT_909522 [Melampsora americana]|nr:hypothetical protein DFH28DRAFT_909522 [Melampsora americana]
MNTCVLKYTSKNSVVKKKGTNTIKTSLDEAGVRVGANTTRERLLDLLNRRIMPKRPRLSDNTTRIGSKKGEKEKKAGSSSLTKTIVSASGPSLDFSIYHVSELEAMLQKVGMDTRGLDREALIQSCKAYSDIIILPDFSMSIPPLNATILTPEAGPSQNVDPGTEFPSLEHGRLTFPRPEPTVLNLTGLSKNRKGKGKAILQSDKDQDWIPEDPVPISEGRNCAVGGTKTAKRSSQNTYQTKGVGDRNLDSTVAEHTRAIAHLTVKLTKSNEKLETLERELRTLTGLFNRFTRKSHESEESVSKTGGRIASRVRFHIACMLGPRAQNKLPRPASSEEKKSWLSAQPIDLVQFDIDLNASDPVEGDSNTTHTDGPGHPDSSPQQISVIRQMMKAVRVQRFCPDFSLSMSSVENKWLWDLAMKIFVKLVECGEYTGIPLTSEGITSIKKKFKSHIQSLKKRYREENWDVARKQKAADEVRRATRMRHLKALRDRTVLSKECFWPLSAIMQAACSDDETDGDEDGLLEESTRANRPCRVRKLVWRSDALEAVCLLVDKYRQNNDESIPGTSPGQKGRPPRIRIRADNRPISRIEAPSSLPLDCYSDVWLSSLSAVQRCQMEIHSEPVLEKFSLLLKSMT